MATVIKLEDPNKDFNRMLYQATRDIMSGMQRSDERKHQMKMQEDRQAQQMEYLEKQAQLNLNNQLLVQKGQQQHKSAIKAKELRNDTVAYDFFNKVSEPTKYGRRLKSGQEALFGQAGATILAHASKDAREHLQKEIQSWNTTNTDWALEKDNIQRATELGVPEKMLSHINKDSSSIKDTYDLYWGDGGTADSIVDETIAAFKVGHLSLDNLSDPNSSQSETLRQTIMSAKGGLGDLSLVNRVLADERFENLITTNSWYNTQLDSAVAKEKRLAMDLKTPPADRLHAENTTIALTAMKRNRIPIDVAKEALKKLDSTELGLAMAKFFKESAQSKAIPAGIKQTIARLGDSTTMNLLAEYGKVERAENEIGKQSEGVTALINHLVANPLDPKIRARENYIRYGHLEHVKNAMQLVNGFTLLASDPIVGPRMLSPYINEGDEDPSNALKSALSAHIDEHGMDASSLNHVKVKYQKEYNQSVAKKLIVGWEGVLTKGTISTEFSDLLAGIMSDPNQKDWQTLVTKSMEHVGPMQRLDTPWGLLDVRIKDLPALVKASIAMGTDTSDKLAMKAMAQLQLENNNSIVLTDVDRDKYLKQLKPEHVKEYFNHRRIQQERDLVIQAGIDEGLVNQNDHLKYNLSTPEAIKADLEMKRNVLAKSTDELIISQGLLSKQSPLTDPQLQLLVNASSDMRTKVLNRNSGMHTLAEQRIYDQTQLTQAHTRNYSALQKIVTFDTTLPKNQMLLRMVAWDDAATRAFIKEAIDDDQSGTDKLGLKNANKLRGWVYEKAIKNFHSTTNTAGLDLDFTPNDDGTFDIFNRNDLTAEGKPKKLTTNQIDGFARLAEEVVLYQNYVKKGMGILPGEAGFLAEDWTGTQKDINLLGASIAGRIFKESVYQGKIPEWGSVLEQGMALASRIAGSLQTLVVEDAGISETQRGAMNVGRYSAAIGDAAFKNPLSVPAVKQAIKKFRNHGIVLGSDIEFEDRTPETTEKKSKFAGAYPGTFDRLFKTAKSADYIKAAGFLGVDISNHTGADDLTYHSAIIDKAMQMNANTATLDREGVAAMMFATGIMHSMAREGLTEAGYKEALEEALPSIAASGAGDDEQSSAVFTQKVNAAITADADLQAVRSVRNGWNTEFWANPANKLVWMQDASKAELRQHLRIGQLLLRKLNYID